MYCTISLGSKINLVEGVLYANIYGMLMEITTKKSQGYVQRTHKSAIYAFVSALFWPDVASGTADP